LKLFNLQAISETSGQVDYAGFGGRKEREGKT